MTYNPYAELKHMHHTARWLWFPGEWVIVNRNHGVVASVAASTADHVTELNIMLFLDRHKLPLEPITCPGGMRTTLRWVMAQLNNGNLWLSTRLALEREARLLGYEESELLACEHAYDYQYCLALLTNLPGLSENWRSSQ